MEQGSREDRLIVKEMNTKQLHTSVRKALDECLGLHAVLKGECEELQIHIRDLKQQIKNRNECIDNLRHSVMSPKYYAIDLYHNISKLHAFIDGMGLEDEWLKWREFHDRHGKENDHEHEYPSV